MPKGDIDLPRERRRDPRLGFRRTTAAEGADALQLDLNPLPDWARKVVGMETSVAKKARWQQRSLSRGRR